MPIHTDTNIRIASQSLARAWRSYRALCARDVSLDPFAIAGAVCALGTILTALVGVA